ncbi:unnamed protein product [Ectocarpus sp. 6 AP-2014]
MTTRSWLLGAEGGFISVRMDKVAARVTRTCVIFFAAVPGYWRWLHERWHSAQSNRRCFFLLRSFVEGRRHCPPTIFVSMHGKTRRVSVLYGSSSRTGMFMFGGIPTIRGLPGRQRERRPRS